MTSRKPTVTLIGHVCIDHNVIDGIKLEGILRCTDIAIVAPMIANYDISYVAQIMKLLPETCLKVLLPQGYMRHISAEGMIEKRKFVEDGQLLPYFDAMVTSDEDIDNALRTAELWATYKEGSNIVVTQSSKGATLFSGGQITQVPTTPIAFSRIKNPVGSGDMFSAQLALGLYNKLDPANAVRRANETTAKALLSKPTE